MSSSKLPRLTSAVTGRVTPFVTRRALHGYESRLVLRLIRRFILRHGYVPNEGALCAYWPFLKRRGLDTTLDRLLERRYLMRHGKWGFEPTALGWYAIGSEPVEPWLAADYQTRMASLRLLNARDVAKGLVARDPALDAYLDRIAPYRRGEAPSA